MAYQDRMPIGELARLTGTKVNTIGQKGDWIEIEVTDSGGAFQKGFVRAATTIAGTSSKSVLSFPGRPSAADTLELPCP